jgi:hypothetical protein
LKKIFIFTLFFCFLSLNSQMLHYNSYIDIPTANYTDGFFVNLDGNFPLKSVSEVRFDPNLGIEYANRGLNLALKWYDGADFAFDISYRIFEEKETSPSIALGIYELSYNRFISPVGSDETYDDEGYADRPPEVISLYWVASKSVNSVLEFTMGVGRGKFVGYGPRSFIPNTDVLFEEKHENWVLGLFMGAKIKLKEPVSFILEADGRDANFAVEYKSPLLKSTLYLIKLEQFSADSDSPYSVRLGLNFSYNLASLYE